MRELVPSAASSRLPVATCVNSHYRVQNALRGLWLCCLEFWQKRRLPRNPCCALQNRNILRPFQMTFITDVSLAATSPPLLSISNEHICDCCYNNLPSKHRMLDCIVEYSLCNVCMHVCMYIYMYTYVYTFFVCVRSLQQPCEKHKTAASSILLLKYLARA